MLTVLWLSAALAAIAFSVASSVRAETERASTEADSARTYYLALGGFERALLWIEWGAPRYYVPPMPVIAYQFPSGDAQVEIIPESSKLNINTATPEDLLKVILAAGASPEQARVLLPGILDWRRPSPGGFTEFDQYYLSLTPSFRSRHASFEEIEELLLIRGMTPDLFYGSFARDESGRFVARGGLRDCLSVYGSNARFDVNTAPPAVLRAVGFTPEATAQILELRRRAPIRTMEQLSAFGQSGPGFARLQIGGLSVWTLRATGRLRVAEGKYSDLKRSVAGLVKFMGAEYNPPYLVLRWYDNAATLPQMPQ